MALAALPTEIIETISLQLDLPDSRSLRLTNSSLNQKSLHQFRNRFFIQHTLKWQDVSDFSTLHSIISHPYFGSGLQHLIIDATPRFAIALWKLKRRITDAREMNEYYALPTGRLQELDDSYSALSSQAEASAKFWNETRTDLNMLTEIFKLRVSILSITFAYDSLEKAYATFAREYCVNSQNEMSRPFCITLSAIAASGITVFSIEHHKTRNYGAISIGRLQLYLSPQLRSYDEAFSSLTSLDLHLRDWRHADPGFSSPDDEKRIPFLLRFLNQCRNLTKLELSCFSTFEPDIAAQLAAHCILTKLKSCSISHFTYTHGDHLLAFLLPSRSSLESLTLSDIFLRDRHAYTGIEEPGWKHVMLRLSHEFNLDSLELRGMHQQGLGRVAGKLVLQGREEVKAALERAVDQGLDYGYWGPAWHLASVAYPFISGREPRGDRD